MRASTAPVRAALAHGGQLWARRRRAASRRAWREAIAVVDLVQPCLDVGESGLFQQPGRVLVGLRLQPHFHGPSHFEVAALAGERGVARQDERRAGGRAPFPAASKLLHLELLEVRCVFKAGVPIGVLGDALLHGPAHVLEAALALGRRLACDALLLQALLGGPLHAAGPDLPALLRQRHLGCLGLPRLDLRAAASGKEGFDARCTLPSD
mmetsp:Transcript_59741/g.173081  ORF Transcript_59741/g.173081 Transcript_59741/m.173081 type:complete len:210 (+) Transcript_59741:178-807(+)